MSDDSKPTDYRNVVSGKTTTWAYGTTRIVRIIQVDIPVEKAFDTAADKIKPELRGIICTVAVEVDHPEVGYLLVGSDNTVPPVVDHIYLMEFTKGGPLGGYWKITREYTPHG